ncbi:MULTISPECIES: twin transmembrane helix small protein [unclassified Roseovarius]|uniref:twin transmembrane helix small protein n=1 Tax=unclassified Roseovarius TaxID=2614913 RepID=UPI00273E581F|nr:MULTISPECIES: twin transmembrane helix small protein [unclassified Roseovarius]
MADDPLFYVVAVACLVVAGIMMFGVITFGRGGEFNRKHANKIMRWRIGAQFIAVVLILLFVFIRRQTGQ